MAAASAVGFGADLRVGEDDPDQALVARALAGEELAFSALYARWSVRVLRFAEARLGNREDAEEVAQEVFVALLRCLPSYQGRSRFGTWLLGIAHHLICRVQRRRARVELVPLAEADATPSPSAPGEGSLDAARALERCARALEAAASPAQREIFWLHYAEGRSANEVAERIRRSPETVRAQLSRTRRVLLENTPGLAETLEP